MVTLALDRIKAIQVMPTVKYIDNVKFDANEYSKAVIGVTVNEGNRPQTVHLTIDRGNAPYVITKPFHHTQKVVAKSSEGIEVTMDVVLNYVLERGSLAMGNVSRLSNRRSCANNELSQIDKFGGPGQPLKNGKAKA